MTSKIVQKKDTKNVDFFHKKRGLSCEVLENLSKIERKVLNLITVERLSNKQVQTALKIGKSSFYKYKKTLKNAGLLNTFYSMDFSQGTPQRVRDLVHPNNSNNPPKKEKKIRLHFIELNVNLIYSDERYSKQLKKANTLFIGEDTIRLYKNSLEIYIKHSFFAETAQKATANSIYYIQKLLVRLENDLHVILMKHRSQNIRICNAHYSEIENEYAKDCNINAEKIRIYTRDDGKLWFLIDNSFNLNEAEAVHPQTAKPDIEKVTSYFNDIRDSNSVLMPSDISKLLGRIMEEQKKTSENITEISAGLAAILKVFTNETQNTSQTERNLEVPNYIGWSHGKKSYAILS